MTEAIVWCLFCNDRVVGVFDSTEKAEKKRREGERNDLIESCEFDWRVERWEVK